MAAWWIPLASILLDSTNRVPSYLTCDKEFILGYAHDVLWQEFRDLEVIPVFILNCQFFFIIIFPLHPFLANLIYLSKGLAVLFEYTHTHTYI